MFRFFNYTKCEQLQKCTKINNHKTKKYADIKNTTSLEYIFFYFH
jgi:hypothetical protein